MPARWRWPSARRHGRAEPAHAAGRPAPRIEFGPRAQQRHVAQQQARSVFQGRRAVRRQHPVGAVQHARLGRRQARQGRRVAVAQRRQRRVCRRHLEAGAHHAAGNAQRARGQHGAGRIVGDDDVRRGGAQQAAPAGGQGSDGAGVDPRRPAGSRPGPAAGRRRGAATGAPGRAGHRDRPAGGRRDRVLPQVPSKRGCVPWAACNPPTDQPAVCSGSGSWPRPGACPTRSYSAITWAPNSSRLAAISRLNMTTMAVLIEP